MDIVEQIEMRASKSWLGRCTVTNVEHHCFPHKRASRGSLIPQRNSQEEIRARVGDRCHHAAQTVGTYRRTLRQGVRAVTAVIEVAGRVAVHVAAFDS